MDILQQQLIALDCKVDALHKLVEQLSHRLNIVLVKLPTDRLKLGIDQPAATPPPLSGTSDAIAHESDHLDPSLLSHKDVLPDTQGWDHIPDYNTTEQALSPELQVRRLTAQVTAAYNRIAALEEQLLAQRGSGTGEQVSRQSHRIKS
jgi:hypothetical protein